MRTISRFFVDPKIRWAPGFVMAAVLAAASPTRGGLPTAAIDELPALAQDQPVTFSVLGDTPYGDADLATFQQHMLDHNLYSPADFLMHVGDIFGGGTPCDEYRYQQVADALRALTVPAFMVPGDNETKDCDDVDLGWIYWRRYFQDFDQGFCGTPPVQRQAARPENFAFVSKGVLFIGLDMLGGSGTDGLHQDDADWVEQHLLAQAASVRAAVVFSHAGPDHGGGVFFDQFVPDAVAFGKPVLYVHGHGHSWIDDMPFGATNIRRIQVNDGDGPPVAITVTLSVPAQFVVEQDPFAGSPLNAAPCADAGPDLLIGSSQQAWLLGMADDDRDPGSANLSITWSKISGPGTVSFTSPHSAETSASFSVTGSYVLRLTANDGALQASDDVLVSVGAVVNDPPVALDDSYETDEDVPLAVGAPGLLVNDVDPDGDALTASVAVQPQHGTLNLAGNGSFTYTPSTNWSGPDSFEYRIDDGRGGLDQATVTLTVFPVNDAPLAEDDSYETPAGTELSVAAPGVLDNDSDVEADALAASLVQGALHGTIDLAADGSFTYVPDPGFAGYDEFLYLATDATEVSTAATVTLAVGIRTFTATADATVRANQASKNFGDDTTLAVKEGPKPHHSYVQFQLDSLDEVLFAKLRLYVSGSADPVELYDVANTYGTSSNAWLESGITWENAPLLEGAPLGTWSSVDNDGWVEMDVTTCIEANGVCSFGLRSNSNSSVTYSSREGDQPPVLIVASVPLRPKTAPRQEFAEAQPRKLGSASPRLLRVVPLEGETGFRLDYELATAARVRAHLFDARGRRLRQLADAMQTAGQHSLHWDGRSDAGSPAGAGVYFLRLQIGDRSWTQKVVNER